jgi:amino acid adenylation domain-containing protein
MAEIGPEGLHEHLYATADRRPCEIAIVADGHATTYRELADDAAALARWLTETGVRPGDRVVVFGPNGTHTAVAFWAVLMCGGVVVMVHPGTRRDKLAWLIADSGAAALVADEALEDSYVGAVDRSPRLGSVIVIGTAPAADVLPRVGRVSSFDVAVKEGARSTRNLPASRTTDLAALIYTSGSTGGPKAVTLTHGNMLAATKAISAYLGLVEEDVLLCVLPLSFDYGLYQLILSVSVGGRLVLERSFDLPGQVLNRVAAEKVTVLPGVPTMFALLARLGNPARWDLSSIRIVTSTGAALGSEQIAWLLAAFPLARVFSMYGLTECKRCTYLPPEDIARKPGSVGIAIPGTEIWLVDRDDRVLGPGEVGELVVSGPTVMAGYWHRPAETARRLRPDRRAGEVVLYTGDLCRMDDEGYLYFVSRLDDVIKTCGEKVAPAEVEAVLRALTGVLDAAVVGVPDDILGHAVKAFVVTDGETPVTPAALRAACRELLEPFMVPRTIELVDALPRTGNGKIEKAALV